MKSGRYGFYYSSNATSVYATAKVSDSKSGAGFLVPDIVEHLYVRLAQSRIVE